MVHKCPEPALQRLIRAGFTDFIDVITFDGAYSLFPAQYDEESGGESATYAKTSLAQLKSTYRSFSDRSSWVVTFEQSPFVPPRLAFGTSQPVRDPLYSSSLRVSPPRGRPIEQYGDIQLCGVLLRSRLLRLTYTMCCVELSQFVQQFLTRLVIAHPGRSNSLCVPTFSRSAVSRRQSKFVWRGCTASTPRWRNSCALALKW